MQEIEKQLEEIKGSVEIIRKWFDEERTDQIRQELINEFFNHHKNIYTTKLNKKIKEMLGI